MTLPKRHLSAVCAAALAFGVVHAQDRERDEELAAAERTDSDDAAAREELLREADAAIEQLREENEAAAALWEEAYGYAVFDTTKGGLIFTGVGGTGVAQPKGGGEEVFMHVGGAGVGLGAGLENYLLVLLIQNEETYREFVEGQWGGTIAAQAAAGEAGVTAQAQFVDGLAAFRMTEGGLIAHVDVTALRFWPSMRLNEVAAAG